MPFLVRVFETCERNVLGQLGNELDGNEQPVSASAEYPTRFRHPWHLWGWTAIAAGLSANGLDELLLVLGRPASVGLLTATLPFACSAGLLILGFGILDKYWLCRGLPMKSVPKLRLTMIGLFILAVALIQLSSTISIIAAMSATVERAESATNTQPQVLHSPDGLCEITIPGDWVEGTEAIDIHPPPVITAFDSTSNILLMVYHESKADLRPMTLGEYLDLSMMRLADGTTEAINSQPVDLQINGYPAMSIELATIYEDERFTYPITVIDTPKRFFGIVGYSSPSQAVTARAGFEAITPTFVCLDTDR